MLLDVRTDDEWAGGRITGSVHIPMDQLMQRLDEVNDRVVCVCAVGARSARVAQFLNAQGREAVNLDGGIHAWANSGFPRGQITSGFAAYTRHNPPLVADPIPSRVLAWGLPRTTSGAHTTWWAERAECVRQRGSADRPNLTG